MERDPVKARTRCLDGESANSEPPIHLQKPFLASKGHHGRVTSAYEKENARMVQELEHTKLLLTHSCETIEER